MMCPFCEKNTSGIPIVLFSNILKKDVNYYKCKSCGSINQFPLPDKDEIKRYYESYFDIKKEMNPGYLTDGNLENFFNERDKTLKEIGFKSQFFKDSSNVELGCANGQFLRYLKNYRAVDIYGIDISKSLIDSISIENVKTFVGDLKPIDNNSVSNLYLFHILEHIPDINKVMDDIKRILKKKGRIVIESPLSGFVSTMFGEKWRFLMPDEHLHIPSYKGLKLLFKRYGFKIIGNSRFGSGFTSGMINSFFKNIFDKSAKKFKFGDRGAFLIIFEDFKE
jgi:SAM-dependent methyltransferase